MSNLMRKSIILAKPESSYGVDPLPDYANGILTSLPDFGFSGDKVERDVVRQTLSKMGHVTGIKRQTLKFSTELKGAGDSSDPSKLTHFDCLLKACGMKPFEVVHLPLSGISGTFEVGETVTGGTSSATGEVVRVYDDALDLKDVAGTFSDAETVTGTTSTATGTTGASCMADKCQEYRPVSNEPDFGSGGLYYYADGILHKLIGTRGNASFDFEVGQYPKLTFNMTGLWVDPADVTIPENVVFEEHLPPRVLSADLTINSYTPKGVNKISLDLGNKIQESKDINTVEGLQEIYISERDPSGSLDPEVDTLANFNPFEQWKTAVKQEVFWSLGETLGNRVNMFLPAVQFGDLGYQDRNDRRTYSLPLVLTGNDDEICLQIG